jgi:DNA polymerase
MISSNDIFLDFETRSAAPLGGTKGVGAWRYSIDPTTGVLCLAYAFGMERPSIWVEGQPQPKILREGILDGCRVHGWNSMSFERAIFENQCATKLGWEVPRVDQYHDTMLDALTLALPGKLEDCAKALNIDNQKMEIGKKLIQKLCKPITTGKLKGTFRERWQYPDDYAQLYNYCMGDVNAERELFLKLPRHLTGIERERALMIMRVNERGLPIDMPLVDSIIEALDYEAEYTNNRFSDLTGIERVTMRARFTAWLQSEGINITDMQAATVAHLKATNLSDRVSAAIDLYDEGNSSSTAKYNKLKAMICEDGTVKNNLIFNKASTGRLAGSGFQAQNLPRLSTKDSEVIIEAFMRREYDFLRVWCGVQTAAKSLIRSSIKAPPYMKFISGDLSSIEAMDTAWVAGEWGMLDDFRKGIDAYVSTAAVMYRILTTYVTDEQRQSGKIAVLSGGFGGGYRALLGMAANYGLTFSDPIAKRIIRDFRKGRPKLVAMWENFREAAMLATLSGDRVHVTDTLNRFSFFREGIFLYMELPSGRLLSFPFPEVRDEVFFGRLEKNVTAMWTDSSPGGNKKWGRRTITGPNFFQSAVQGSARDILFEAHDRAEAQGFPLVLSVHDEGLSLVPDDPKYMPEQYDRLMTEVPNWCYEIPIKSKCWEGPRYKK